MIFSKATSLAHACELTSACRQKSIAAFCADVSGLERKLLPKSDLLVFFQVTTLSKISKIGLFADISRNKGTTLAQRTVLSSSEIGGQGPVVSARLGGLENFGLAFASCLRKRCKKDELHGVAQG